MSNCRFTTLVLVLLSLGLGQDREGIDLRAGLPVVVDVLRAARASGALVYRGRCDGSPDFPKVRLPRNRDSSPLEALRGMFEDDRAMRVTQDAGNIFRMIEADVPRDVLDVKLGHISFVGRHGETVNNPYVAMHIVLSSPEVRDFMKGRNIGPIAENVFEAVPEETGGPGKKQLPGDLREVTVAEALDYVVQSYSGIWIYESCPTNPTGQSVFFSFVDTSPPHTVAR